MPGDMSNVREDGSFPPAFDHVAIVDGDRTQLPGTLMRDPRSYPQQIEREARQHWAPTQDRASDKFAIRSFTVPDVHAHQLLPVDQGRKIARIQVVGQIGGQFGILVGTQTDVEAFAGTQTGAFRAAVNLMWIPAISLSAGEMLPPFLFSCKGALYYCAVTTGDVNQTMVQAFIERFDSGTPVT